MNIDANEFKGGGHDLVEKITYTNWLSIGYKPILLNMLEWKGFVKNPYFIKKLTLEQIPNTFNKNFITNWQIKNKTRQRYKKA